MSRPEKIIPILARGKPKRETPSEEAREGAEACHDACCSEPTPSGSTTQKTREVDTEVPSGNLADAGFERTVVRVEGMDCASCAATVEKRVGRLPGMHRAIVNFAAGRLDAEHDPELALEKIEKTIRDAGYGIGETREVERTRFWLSSRTLLTASSALLFAVGAVLQIVGAPGFGWVVFYVAAILVGGLPVFREGAESSTVALVLSVLSILIMPMLAYLKGRTGREMGSRALVADSKETWVCAYLSVALLAAVGLNALFGWWWADPVGALAMLPVILWQGWETLGEAREEGEEE